MDSQTLPHYCHPPPPTPTLCLPKPYPQAYRFRVPSPSLPVRLLLTPLSGNPSLFARFGAPPFRRANTTAGEDPPTFASESPDGIEYLVLDPPAGGSAGCAAGAAAGACVLYARSWLKVAPSLCEGTSPWPTPAYLEAWPQLRSPERSRG